MLCGDRDGRESFVVTKVFDVEHLESDVAVNATDDLDFIREIPVAEVCEQKCGFAINCFEEVSVTYRYFGVVQWAKQIQS